LKELEKIKSKFTIDFCSSLEYELCEIFKNTESLKSYWCDGVLHDIL